MTHLEPIRRRHASVVAFVMLFSLLIGLPSIAWARQTGPRATGVRSEVSGGTITITYDLDAAGSTSPTFTVTIQASLDGGQTFTVRPVSVTGDVGPNVRAGTGKRIVWEATKDVQILQLNRFSFSVGVAPAAGSAPARTQTAVSPGSSTSTAPGEAIVKGGFSLLHEEDFTPKGFLVDFTKNVITAGSGHIGITGEFGFYSGDGLKAVTPAGGVRYTFDLSDGKLKPYFSFTAGVVNFRGEDFSDTKPHFATGLGIVVAATEKMGLFGQFDTVTVRVDGEFFRDVRFSVGVSWSLK